MTGPVVEGQVQVRKEYHGPGPDQTSDSLPIDARSSRIVRKTAKCSMMFPFSAHRSSWSLCRRSIETIRDLFLKCFPSSVQISYALPLARTFMKSESRMELAICCFVTASPCFQSLTSFFHSVSSFFCSMVSPSLAFFRSSVFGIHRSFFMYF